MSTPLRVLAFAAGLAAVFGLAFGVGRVADPDTAPAAQHETGHETGGHAGAGHGTTQAPDETDVHLSLSRRELPPGEQTVAFQVQDASGAAVTSYDVEHE